MAHSCPDCYETCYCSGDIDDLLLEDEDAVAGCTHCAGATEDDIEESDEIFREVVGFTLMFLEVK